MNEEQTAIEKQIESLKPKWEEYAKVAKVFPGHKNYIPLMQSFYYLEGSINALETSKEIYKSE
jgi:hypothetical protein